MSYQKKPIDAAGSLNRELAQELLDETLLANYVKIEDYLMVALGVRSCSFVTIPAEFPNAGQFGREIDLLCSDELHRLVEAPVEKKPLLIPKLRSRIQEAFKKVVLSSDTYKAHIAWSRKLLLQTVDVEVRPSIHELYLFTNSAVKKQLKRLFALRAVARKKLMFSKGFTESRTNLAYAEELSEDYVNLLGELLGYPSCCVEKYVNDRLGGGLSVETRASVQLKQVDEGMRQLSVYAYFARNFFPCQPTCRNAIEIGKSIFQLLAGINPRLGAVYLQCLRENAKIVEEYPEFAQQYKQKMEKMVGDT